IAFRFQFPSLEEPVEFVFESTEYGYHESTDETPRVSVVSPGSDCVRGEFLSRLAQITYASNEERELLPEIGTISPAGTAFTKIICLSYGDLPGFSIPGIYVQAKEQIAREIKQGEGRFIYCGIHDLVSELEHALTDYNVDPDGRLRGHNNPSGEPVFACLKSTEELSAEFVRSMEHIEQNQEKQEIWDNVFQLLQEHNDLRFIEEITFPNLREEELESFFMNLNSGQQVLFHALATFILGISPRSLVLFHEPESGTLPALVPVMMNSIKYILERQNAFMIVSTRSTDIFSEDAYKSVSAVNSKKELAASPTPEREKLNDTTEVVISHILGRPNDIFPHSS
ncbi:MAG: hypothetical protein C0490_24030, partial [Marivirga sp.]|nr:hypothetical protein [Marivirga sp.]